MVIRPVRRPASSTRGSFSTRFFENSVRTSSREMPSRAVTSGMRVMAVSTVRVSHSSWGMKRVSRLVMMPSSVMSSATTGRPETRYCAHSPSSSARVALGPMVTGSEIMPDSERFTVSTWRAWSSTERLRWMIPMPPWRAMAIASGASVTVSMAAETMGMFKRMLRVSRVPGSASAGMTSVALGRSRTSS